MQGIQKFTYKKTKKGYEVFVDSYEKRQIFKTKKDVEKWINNTRKEYTEYLLELRVIEADLYKVYALCFLEFKSFGFHHRENVFKDNSEYYQWLMFPKCIEDNYSPMMFLKFSCIMANLIELIENLTSHFKLSSNTSQIYYLRTLASRLNMLDSRIYQYHEKYEKYKIFELKLRKLSLAV